jgi:hypothetical protein
VTQGQFSKEEAAATREAVQEMFDGLAKSKSFNYIGHLNDIMLFLRAAEANAPSEATVAT